ncbi:MAG TPA: hypothetical protein VE010_22895, partial [Thermoanaerobaculia bacterium]|nr:hypothetical protein [Thermoanaerobaculia bacterium]
ENPYELKQREGLAYLWDASLYNGRYYLYFSPVPILLFVLPFRVVSGGLPSDELTAAFFFVWAFLASVAFAWRALRHSEARQLPFPLWVLLIGTGTIVPWVLLEVRVYEVASACLTAMAATWAFTLLRFLERPTVRTAAWMGLFLALTIAAKPNMIVLLVVAAAAMWKQRRKLAAIALVPVLVIGSAYAIYNYARFQSPFETGITYQLTIVPMKNYTPCRLCTASDASRFFNTLLQYLSLPPKFMSDFPFVDLRWNDVDKNISFPATPEQVGGIAAITPLTMVGTALIALLFLARRTSGAPPRAAMLLMAAAWLVLLTLSTCLWLTARYSLDYWGLMLLASVIGIEQGLTFLREMDVSVRPLRALIALLACYSIVTGLLLGFTGRRGAFKRQNPELFFRIEQSLR